MGHMPRMEMAWQRASIGRDSWYIGWSLIRGGLLKYVPTQALSDVSKMGLRRQSNSSAVGHSSVVAPLRMSIPDGRSETFSACLLPCSGKGCEKM